MLLITKILVAAIAVITIWYLTKNECPLNDTDAQVRKLDETPKQKEIQPKEVEHIVEEIESIEPQDETPEFQEPDVETEKSTDNVDDFSGLTLTELRKLAKEKSVSRYSKLNRSQLLEALTTYSISGQ